MEIVYEWKLVIGFVILLSILYIWKKKSRNKQGDGIPQFSTWAYIWNLIFCPVKAQEFQKLCGTLIIQILNGASIATLKKKLYKISWGGYHYIALSHPEVAQEVLKSYTVINKDWIYNILHPWLGTGLLTSSNDKWRNRRKLLTPAFHFRILEDFQGIFNDQSNILIEKLKEKQENKEFLMDELITLCTLDVIEDSAMGMHINAQNRSDTDYIIAINEITSALAEWFAKPWYWFSPIFNLSPLGRKFHKDIETVHEFDRKVIREKKQKMIEELEDNQTIDNFQEEKEVTGVKKKRAFLDLLLYHHLTDGSLSEEDIREEVDTFMFEGHDTTAMGISWSLYLLGLHSDIQEKVYQELQEIFGEDMDKSITTDELKRMKYLECIIKETLRLYPPVSVILRKNPSDMKVGNYILPANSSLAVNIYGIHHNPTVFENPEVFDPDRFLPENCEKRHPFAFIPFSAGPRNCIGQRFAMMEMKTVLANVLRHFRVKSMDHNSAMGMHINAQNRSDTDYIIAINEITSALAEWFAKPWYWFSPIFNLSPLGRKFHKDIETVHEFDRKVIREKKQKMIEELEDNQTIDNFQEEKEVTGVKKKRAFLDLLLYHHLTDGSLSEEDIREEVDTFMFEGHDTTAMGISWSLYLLGLHSDIQEKVYQELQEIFGEDMDKSITTDELKRMKYLECIIKETLRLYPPVSVILRKNPSDMKVGNYILPANSSLAVNIYGIHHNPTVFENPEVFDPDRFLPENCEKRHPFAFIPFSAGPRNCIGQRFAMLEMKTILANVLRHFRVKSMDHRDKIFESGDIILRPKFGIRMTIKKR
ncbi:cytochrome P450 4c3-like [Centruroides sculpturatus]|uniref:cytochrome P450 4c3-like n=1 Tax=Centruroides sculpturatus TaxID=218467 RepID=UPI000C6CBCFA|nr:cytochrome P450 4c3-like [Centruroides sculpturatus]